MVAVSSWPRYSISRVLIISYSYMPKQLHYEKNCDSVHVYCYADVYFHNQSHDCILHRNLCIRDTLEPEKCPDYLRCPDFLGHFIRKSDIWDLSQPSVWIIQVSILTGFTVCIGL